MHMKCLLYSNFFEYNVYIFNRNNFYVSIKKRKRKSLQTFTISLRKKKKKFIDKLFQMDIRSFFTN